MRTLVFAVVFAGAACSHRGPPAARSPEGSASTGDSVISDRAWTMAYLATVDASGQSATFAAALNVRRTGKALTTHVILSRPASQGAAPLRYELPGELSLPAGGNHVSVVPVLELRAPVRKVHLYTPIDPDILPPSLGIRAQSPPPAETIVREALEIGPLELPGVMPAGELTLAQRDPQGLPRVTGRRTLDELAPGARLELPGKVSPELSGSRSAELEVIDREAHKASEHVVITLENRSDHAADVVVLDALTRAQRWRITEAAGGVDKYDEHTVRLGVTVPARGRRTVDYRVAYAW